MFSLENLSAAVERQEQKRARRNRQKDQVNKFLDWVKEIFSDRMPFLVPSFVEVERKIRKPVVKWRHVHRNSMNEDYWLRCLHDALTEEGCVQVKLGPESFDLCALDVDADELVTPTLDAMPFLANTLQTYGSKGCTFWFFIEGDYPKHKKVIECAGYKIEFLTERCLSTIWGTHYATGESYQRINDVPPISIRFEDIKLPDGGEWKGKPASNGAGTHAQRNRRHRHGTAGKHGGIDWKAYDVAREADDGLLVEILVDEYFSDANWYEDEAVWRCGDRTGRGASGRGSFAIEPNGRCTDFEFDLTEPAAHPTLINAICSEERNEHGECNTYEDVFGFLATKGDEYNFFMPTAPEELPQVLLPHPGVNESAFAEEVAKHLPKNSLFNKDGLIVELDGDDALGTDDSLVIAPFGLTTNKFSAMTSLRLRFRSEIEGE
jgi:hypothetical protein